jgi:hypothetical protein
MTDNSSIVNTSNVWLGYQLMTRVHSLGAIHESSSKIYFPMLRQRENRRVVNMNRRHFPKHIFLLSHAHQLRLSEASKKAWLALFVYKLSRPPENISFSLKQSKRSPRVPHIYRSCHLIKLKIRARVEDSSPEPLIKRDVHQVDLKFINSDIKIKVRSGEKPKYQRIKRLLTSGFDHRKTAKKNAEKVYRQTQ